MKRERERKWYYVYGNLTEQFKQKYNSVITYYYLNFNLEYISKQMLFF